MKTDSNQIMLLQLAAAQLSLSLLETEKPFNDLTRLFLEIVEHHRQIDDLLSEESGLNVDKLHLLHKQAEDKVKTAVIDFQFYDRMSQRLHHILNHLQQAIIILVKHDDDMNEEQWNEIFNQIEQSYTMQEEKELYFAIKSGEGFESAVENLIAKTREKEAIEADIELF
ncbi:MAG: hypothetical protein OEY19_03500 [Gammaproteobacteria bacterium]|nr:hypothetical protein [Gammaproteobacteria bacterium]